MLKTPILSFVSRYASQLRFPWLLAVTLGLFVLDVIIPDLIPFVDEVLLALIALILGSWRRQNGAAGESKKEVS